MKRLLLSLIVFLCCLSVANAQKHLILNTTGYGFDRNAANGINADYWSYIQQFASLTYNGQDASVTAVRLHVQWEQYEPTVGNYHGAKLATAIAAIKALKPGMKVALHFSYLRPGAMNDSYLAENEIARIYDGTKAQENIGWTAPSIFSASARTRYMKYVGNAMASISAHYNDLLYVQMGNSSAEEYIIPIMQKVPNGPHYTAMYEQAAIDAWRQEYLPCRYPNQTTVTWGANTYDISEAPHTYPGPWSPWNSAHEREYHRFAAWGLMKFHKQFRDTVKSYSSNTKVLYFIPGFGTSQGNMVSMHSATIPMALNEFDGIYTSDGVGDGDNKRKIIPLDVLKGTNPNKIAAIEFDPDDLGQIDYNNPGIWPGIVSEWFPRAYKHGADYIHLAMKFHPSEIPTLAQPFAAIKATYLNGSYTPPARQAAVSKNIYPDVFTGNFLFDGTWDAADGDNWPATDLNPVSVSMSDAGYWENIWTCSGTPAPCDFNVTASGPTGNVQVNSSISLSSTCSGSQCSGVTYQWSGNGLNVSGQNTGSFNAPNTPGTYTYTVTASKSGCTAKTANVSITVVNSGGNPCNYVDKQNVGTWNGLNVQTRQYTVNGSAAWLIVTAIQGSSVDKHFPRGANFADRTDISWSGTFNKTCLGGGATNWGGLSKPSGITTPAGYVAGTEPDGAEYFQQSCTPPSAPSLSASPSTITPGNSSTLSASGCSGGVITWSHSLGTGASKSVSPTTTTTYKATCSIGGCTSSEASVVVTVDNSGTPFSQCLESESQTGTGAVTSDPNASNGQTRGEENNYNHYVDYAITGVPSAGTYYVTLRYYSSAAPTISVTVNGSGAQTINLANSGSWNIVWTTRQFSVTLPAGSSTLRISGTGGGSCRQDRICVSNSQGSPIVLEADEAGAIERKAFTVFPNPSKGVFTTDFYLEKGKKGTIVISDMQGRAIYRQHITGQGLHRERINLTGKASGMLLVQLQTDKGVQLQKVNLAR